jgi:putative DNA polymerase III, alpha subunit|nr:MAG TPA: DNA polymerase III, alpha subunit [Caudoviricetes sp.]
MTKYNNLHLNTHQSNIFKPDSVANYREYAKRAKELGQKVLVAMEHCYSGNLFEAYTVAQEHGLKLLSGVDFNIRLGDGDYSLIMISKNNEGKTVLNELISLASTQENILTVKDLLDNATENIIITTSGINSVLLSKYADEVIKSLDDSYEVYIELQPHNTKMISEVNDLGLEWIDKGFQPILGLDTHYVSEEDATYRDIFLKSAKEFYFEEEDSVLDFPTTDEILQRFYDQGIVPNDIAELAIENTLIADEWEGISFDKEIKMITLYEGETHEQKVKRLHNLFNKAWVEDRKHIDKSKWNDYIEAIKFESNIITETGMEDYFLFNTKMIELGTTKYGGILTKSGRGSAPSMYVNKLLNLTNIDRLEAPIELYPTRFMSISRILESRSLPDIDFNTAHPEPFVKASKELLGEHNAYQMVAYGTLQDKDAFRTYCRGIGLSVDEFADIPDKLEEYENHSMWGKLIKASKKFVGVIKSFSPHPCAMLLLNNDIRSETGVIKAKDGQYLALIDSYNSDVYKYLKNDVLTVSVYEIIGKVYESIGKPIDDVRTLIKNTQDDPKIWKLFEDGIVATLNQAGTVSGKPQIMQYAPKSIRELSMWVAAIRPSFATLRDTFLNRKPFSYNIPEFDALLQSSDNFILFQENIMKVLQYVGFPEGETYSLLKAIAKKKPGIIEPIHDRFIEGFVKQTGSEEDALEVWKIIENSVQYGFNSSHAYSVALDCLYGAYLKANYPINYYTETLNIYRDNVDMQGYLIEELPYFGIKLRGIKFGQSVRNYTHNGNEIFKGISTIKYLNDKVSDNMYDFYHNHYTDDMDIVDVFKYIIDNKLADNRQMNILIKLGFFYDINKNTSVLLAVYNSMTGYQSTKPIPQFLKYLGVTKLSIKYSTTLKNPQERIVFLKQYYEFLSNNAELLPKFTLEERFAVEKEYLGYLSTTLDSLENSFFIEEIGKGNNPWFTLYDLSTGLQRKIRGLKKDITDPNGKRLIGVGDVIEIHATKDLPRNILVDGKWTKSKDQTEPYLAKISILSKEKLSKLL